MAFKTFILRIASAVNRRKPNAPGHIESNSLELYLREFKVKENVETQENWIHQYKSELRKRDKILALTSHLNAHIGHLERISEEQGRLTPSDSSKLLQYSRDLLQVSSDYCEHIQRLQNLERTRPPGKLANEFLLKRERRPHAQWKRERIACQLRGGCCLHQCGCCERWSAIQIDAGSAKSMHCDSDCECCARYKKSIATTPVPATTLAATSVAT